MTDEIVEFDSRFKGVLRFNSNRLQQWSTFVSILWFAGWSLELDAAIVSFVVARVKKLSLDDHDVLTMSWDLLSPSVADDANFRDLITLVSKARLQASAMETSLSVMDESSIALVRDRFKRLQVRARYSPPSLI